MSKLTTFESTDLQILSRELVWQGYFNMVKFTFRHKLFAGGFSEPVTRELFERGNAVVVIPYDPQTDQLILIEQIRVGAFDHNINPWLIELVAGIIEVGERPIEVAKRETLEETGLQTQRCQKIMSYLSSPGGMSERIDLYIAQVKASEIKEIAGLEAEGEDIRVFAMDRQQAYDAIEQGKITNASSIIGIQWLALNHQRIKQEWLSNA
ncbi:MAG: ADP-ribose diphosphatase [Gammaproteobacteria bacterium]|nr:ADP-ribose diphosphatase [Gammaproteobacteria bacterium]